MTNEDEENRLFSTAPKVLKFTPEGDQSLRRTYTKFHCKILTLEDKEPRVSLYLSKIGERGSFISIPCLVRELLRLSAN